MTPSFISEHQIGRVGTFMCQNLRPSPTNHLSRQFYFNHGRRPIASLAFKAKLAFFSHFKYCTTQDCVKGGVGCKGVCASTPSLPPNQGRQTTLQKQLPGSFFKNLDQIRIFLSPLPFPLYSATRPLPSCSIPPFPAHPCLCLAVPS